MANRASDTITLKNIEIAYEHLLEPTKKMSGDGMEYSVQVIVPKDHAQVGDLTAIVKKQLGDIFPDIHPSKLKIAVRDNDAEGNSAKYDHLKNTLFFNARRQHKKGRLPIVSRYNEPLLSVGPDQLFSGCICNVVINFFTYNHPTSKGVAASIEALQIVDNVNVKRRDGQVDTSNAFEALDRDESIDNFAPKSNPEADSPPQEDKVVDMEEKRQAAGGKKDTDLPW